MNQGFVKLLAERSDEVEKFLAGLNEVRGEVRKKARDLRELIEVEDYQNVQPYDWPPPRSPVHFLQYDIYKDGKRYLGIAVRISPSGWETLFFPGKARDRSKLQALLNELEIPFESDGHFTYPERFDYDEDLSRIAPVVQDIVDKLSRSVG